jgi:hypothetical protein
MELGLGIEIFTAPATVLFKMLGVAIVEEESRPAVGL